MSTPKKKLHVAKAGRPPKEPVKASNKFRCCETNFDGVEAMKAHLKEVHNLTETQGRREMISHIDCRDSFHSEYKWTIAEVVFYQFTTNPRHKHDPMRFE